MSGINEAASLVIMFSFIFPSTFTSLQSHASQVEWRPQVLRRIATGTNHTDEYLITEVKFVDNTSVRRDNKSFYEGFPSCPMYLEELAAKVEKLPDE